MSVLDWLRLSEKKPGLDEDDPATTILHAKTIQRKPFLKRLYLDFYLEMQKTAEPIGNGLLVELGSGGGFIKEVMPDVVTTDILDLPHTDRRFSVLEMPFDDASVSAFFMLHVFHHVKDSHRFLTEMDRCLKAPGKIFMIEPAGTPLARTMYRHLHAENFDPDGEWGFADGGPLSGANAALPWIVFKRDRKRFEKEFPHLRIKKFVNHRPISPALSGGVSYVQFAPAFAYPVIRALEKALSPLSDAIGMLTTIEIDKLA